MWIKNWDDSSLNAFITWKFAEIFYKFTQASISVYWCVWGYIKKILQLMTLFGSEHISDLRRQSVWSYLNQLFLCKVREGALLSKIHFLQNVFIACVVIYIPSMFVMQAEKYCWYQYAKFELPIVRGLVMVNMCIKKLPYRSNLSLLDQRGWSGEVKEHVTSMFL